jgi:hypothetical protein
MTNEKFDYETSLKKEVQAARDGKRPRITHAEILRRSELRRANLIMQRVKAGKEKIYTSKQIRRDLGL